MNKPESGLYQRFKHILLPCPIELKRVENSMDTGTPDVYYYTESNEGWIELKHIPRFPVRRGTPIRIPFRPGQYSWFKARFRLNPKTTYFLIVQIYDVVFMFKNSNVKEVYSFPELVHLCSYQWTVGRAHQAEIYRVLNELTTCL